MAGINVLFLGHVLVPVLFLLIVAIIGITTDFIGDKIDEKFEEEAEKAI